MSKALELFAQFFGSIGASFWLCESFLSLYDHILFRGLHARSKSLLSPM